MADTTQLKEIAAQLRQLSPDQIALVSQIIRLLSRRDRKDAWESLLAAETSLRKDWDTPEEDAALADL